MNYQYSSSENNLSKNEMIWPGFILQIAVNLQIYYKLKFLNLNVKYAKIGVNQWKWPLSVTWGSLW